MIKLIKCKSCSKPNVTKPICDDCNFHEKNLTIDKCKGNKWGRQAKEQEML